MGDSDHDQDLPGRSTGQDADADVLERFRAACAASADAHAEGRAEGAGRSRSLPDRLCQAVLEVLPVDAVAISVHEESDIAVPVGVSDQDAAAAESLQFTLREGPCLTAYRTRQAVGIPDVDDPDARARSEWPTYLAEVARHTPFRSVVAYPLLISGGAIGSLCVYRRTAGRPAILADLATASTALDAGAPVNAITGMTVQIATAMLDAEVSAGIQGEPEHPWIAGPSTTDRQRVWVAQGMIMKLNRVNADQALDLLRAHSYTAGRLIDAVAADIVTRQLPVPALDSRP